MIEARRRKDLWRENISTKHRVGGFSGPKKVGLDNNKMEERPRGRFRLVVVSLDDILYTVAGGGL